jgi:hypothetical protein
MFVSLPKERGLKNKFNGQVINITPLVARQTNRLSKFQVPLRSVSTCER